MSGKPTTEELAKALERAAKALRGIPLGRLHPDDLRSAAARLREQEAEIARWKDLAQREASELATLREMHADVDRKNSEEIARLKARIAVTEGTNGM